MIDRVIARSERPLHDQDDIENCSCDRSHKNEDLRHAERFSFLSTGVENSSVNPSPACAAMRSSDGVHFVLRS